MHRFVKRNLKLKTFIIAQDIPSGLFGTQSLTACGNSSLYKQDYILSEMRQSAPGGVLKTESSWVVSF